jgi:hypothetical protein
MQIEVVTKSDLDQLHRKIDNLTQLLADGIPATRRNDKEYCTRLDVIKEFPISLSSLDNYRKKGLIKAYKINRKVLYKVSEIEKNLEALKDGKFRK